jgi:signal transduction histidine kinase
VSTRARAPGAGDHLLARTASRLTTIDPLVADTVLAAALAIPLLIDLSRVEVPGDPSPFRSTDPLGYLLVGLLVVPLAFRRRHPMAVFGVILTACVITAILAYLPASYGFGLIVATYTVARWCDRRQSLVALVAALAFSVFVKVRFLASGVQIDLFEWPLDVAYIAGGWFLGDSLRTRTLQAAELERNRDALAQQAVEREHLRIARELHDTVGHSLSGMVLYAGQADRILEDHPVRARELLGTVIASGRETLEEMDRLVRVLRSEAPVTATVRNVDSLADEFRGLGLPVDVTITGVARALPEAVDLTAYRITQEALTNTLKHADADSAAVRLEYGADALSVTITDDGTGCARDDGWSPTRHGLTGMRERAAALGGDLRVGNRADGRGFSVRVDLPTVVGESS